MGFKIVQNGVELVSYTAYESSDWVGTNCTLQASIPFEFYTYNQKNTSFGRAYKIDSGTVNGM